MQKPNNLIVRKNEKEENIRMSASPLNDGQKLESRARELVAHYPPGASALAAVFRTPDHEERRNILRKLIPVIESQFTCDDSRAWRIPKRFNVAPFRDVEEAKASLLRNMDACTLEKYLETFNLPKSSSPRCDVYHVLNDIPLSS